MYVHKAVFIEAALSAFPYVTKKFIKVISGMYGDLKDLGSGNAILIVIQLLFAGVLHLKRGEVVTKEGARRIKVDMGLLVWRASLQNRIGSKKGARRSKIKVGGRAL